MAGWRLFGVGLWIASLMACGLTVEDEDGERVCLDDFLAGLGEDRSGLERAAERRGIEASAVLDELMSTATEIVDSVIDCAAMESLEDLSAKTGGQPYQANNPKQVVDRIIEHNDTLVSPTVDLVILLDVTGSMADDLDEVRDRLDEIIRSLDDKTVRLGFATYRDANVDAPWYDRNDGGLVSPDDREIDRMLSRAEATGGGDLPESLYDAAHKTITELTWSSETRAVVLKTADQCLAPPRSR